MGRHSVFERSTPSDLIRGWKPVRVKKTRQSKKLELESGPIGTEGALPRVVTARTWQADRPKGMSGYLGKAPGKAHRAWNEGVGEHVRTRFHGLRGNWTLEPKKLRTAVGFAPNEENLFLLPDRPLSGANSLERRSSRLT